MNDRDAQGPRTPSNEPQGDDRRDGGPKGTSFLQLEMSKLVLADAERLVPEVGREILRKAIHDRLEERLGDRLRAVGRLVADAAVDDMEANLSIESQIKDRREARKGFDETLRQLLATVSGGGPPPQGTP